MSRCIICACMWLSRLSCGLQGHRLGQAGPAGHTRHTWLLVSKAVPGVMLSTPNLAIFASFVSHGAVQPSACYLLDTYGAWRAE